MEPLIIDAYGKINLALDVLYKRSDGYHEINTVMQQISLKDRLIFKELDKGIEIESRGLKVPLDGSNLVCKAWEHLKAISEIDKGIHITIEKNIPIAAGLAGGSTDAAATLKALNQLWNLNLSKERLMEIGVKIGADVPFCLLGGTALAEGIGEVLTPLDSFQGVHILLGNPGIGVSTEYAYGKLDLKNKDPHDLNRLIACIKSRDLECVGESVENIMEAEIIGENPIIKAIKQNMLSTGALGTLMSGSGPTVFGIYQDKPSIIKAKEKLLEIIDKVYICETM